jgi:hypothetical protein
MKRTILASLLVLGLLPLSRVSADTIVLPGGSEVRGVVLAEDDGGVRLLLPGGDVLALRRADVKEVVRDADAPKPGQHMRYREPDESGGGLDVAVTYYVHPGGGPRVDLVGAVHIADPAFFRRAQKLLDAATVVLYEGVKAADATAAEFEKATDEPNPVRELQQKLAKWFGLAFQLEAIDYTRENFVHADLTAEEFLGLAKPGSGTDEKPASAGEAAEGLMGQVGAVAKLLKLAGPLIDLLMGQEESAGPLRKSLKKQFARALGTMDVQGALGAISPEAAALLLTKRNAVVIKRLLEQRETVEGSIAVFYGAAHLTGIEKALVEKHGYRRAGARWIRAWDVEK